VPLQYLLGARVGFLAYVPGAGARRVHLEFGFQAALAEHPPEDALGHRAAADIAGTDEEYSDHGCSQ